MICCQIKILDNLISHEYNGKVARISRGVFLMQFEDRIRSGYLFDLYGELLNENQKEIYEEYFIEDLSMSEIANERGITRQSVSDLIKRCTQSLEKYEKRLGLLQRFLDIRSLAEKIEEISADKSTYESEASRQKINELSKEIAESL